MLFLAVNYRPRSCMARSSLTQTSGKVESSNARNEGVITNMEHSQKTIL